MDFVALPEHLNCSFFGSNTRILFRAEAGTETGGVCIQEFHEHPPYVTVYGDTAMARHLFLNLVRHMRFYIDDLYRNSGIPSDSVHSLHSTWFQVDVRGQGYRACFYGTHGRTHATLHGSFDKARLVPDLEALYSRLDTTYRRFYGLEDVG